MSQNRDIISTGLSSDPLVFPERHYVPSHTLEHTTDQIGADPQCPVSDGTPPDYELQLWNTTQ